MKKKSKQDRWSNSPMEERSEGPSILHEGFVSELGRVSADLSDCGNTAEEVGQACLLKIASTMSLLREKFRNHSTE